MSAPRPDHRIEENRLTVAAAGGDEVAFGKLVEPLRGEIHAHCYRMLGSLQDTEDALQETLLGAWRSIGKFERRSSFRAWLYRIATNSSLDLLSKRKRRHLATEYGPSTMAEDGPGPPLVESVWIEAYPEGEVGIGEGFATPESRYERRESVELAFIASLQHLPATQRAVLILREVLGFSAKEVAEIMDTTVAATNSALQRARKTLDERLPERSQQQTLRSLGDERTRELVESYLTAWEKGDIDGIADLLAEEAVLSMPPMAAWYRGDEVFAFLEEWDFSGRVYGAEGSRDLRVIPTTANAQLAFGTYVWDPDNEVHRPSVFQVLTLRGSKIEEITGFVMPEIFTEFGLPAELPRSA